MCDGMQNWQLSQDNFENIANFGLSRAMYNKNHDDEPTPLPCTCFFLVYICNFGQFSSIISKLTNVMIWKRSYGYQTFIIFVKYVIYDWG